MKTDIIEKWRKTGLLKGIDASKEVECANLLEEMIQFLIKKYPIIYCDFKSQSICSTLIPIVRRIFDVNLKKIPSASWLYDDYIVFFDKNPPNGEFRDEHELKLCEKYLQSLISVIGVIKPIVKTGIEIIEEERQRQVSVEGYTSEHDDSHVKGELSLAAISYIEYEISRNMWRADFNKEYKGRWPFEREWFKPSEDNIKNLAKAGALIAAEIDRLHRLKDKEK